MASSILAQHRHRLLPILGSVAAVGLVSKLVVDRTLADSPSDPPKVFGRGPALVSLPLESSDQVNHNTKRLRFRLPDKDAVTGLPLTSSVLTLSWPEGRWLPTVRPYTPVSSSDEPGYLDLLVKRYPDGKASTYLHSLVPGQSLRFLAALRGHQWEANSYPHVTLIAGGAGITPIYQLAQGILNNPDDKTAITAVFGVNGDQDILFRKEFDQFEKQFPGRFKAIYTVSQPDKASPYRKGYVNKQLLQEVAPSPIGRDTKVFVCGPPAMEAALVGSKSAPGVLEQLGYRKDQIHRF